MKKTFLILSLIFLSIQVFAERVDKNTAMKVAKAMINKADLNEMATRNYSNMYIFSGENSFVIVSADDRAYPIIGYSNNNPFVINNATSNVSYWLNKINNEIQYAIDNDIEATEDIQNEWKALAAGNRPTPKNRATVDALVTAKWSQDEPYNGKCPGGSMTGCGATAMAMVMNYWEWPVQGVGTHSYEENDYGTIYVDFTQTTYDWDNMTDVYDNTSTQVEKDAVATLMYHCGVALSMDYGIYGSAAYPDDVIGALIEHFNYKTSIREYINEDCDEEQWIDILKDELDAGRPVIYNGWDIEGGGHSFVCDGYDANNKFHFNWGWEGDCDGYYSIGALSPGTGGIGSGSGQYNELNYILTGIEPNESDDPNTFAAPTNLTISAVNNTTLSLSWDAVEGAIGYGVYQQGSTEALGYVINPYATVGQLNANSTYCFTVTALDENQYESEHSDVECGTTKSDNEVVGPPTNIKIETLSTTSLKISWDPVEGALGYGVIYNNNYIGGTYETFIEIREPSPNNEYCYQLFSITEITDGMITGYSAYSERVCGLTTVDGISENATSFNIYPNPVNDMLIIETENNIEEINIYNITGVKVHNEKVRMNDGQYTVDVQKLDAGTYIIEVKTNNNNIIKRFIKK